MCEHCDWFYLVAHLQNACSVSGERADLTLYLAALAGADSIVVARGLVLTHKTGLVSARRWRQGGWAGEEIIRAGAGVGALAAHRCKHTISHLTTLRFALTTLRFALTQRRCELTRGRAEREMI